VGDVVEREFVGKVAFDKPQRFSNRIHSSSHVSMKPA
jgi:hypothetical protein